MDDQHADNQSFGGGGHRLAPAGGFCKEELQLALRNRGTPLEALRYPITPTGLHYLLVHFDIPDVDARTWRLKVGGLVARPLSLTLEEIAERPPTTQTVTLECAGNGRALLDPRPVSQPWLQEAVGTATWTGTPLEAILEAAGVQDRAVEVLFTALDCGVQGGELQWYQRSLSIEEALRPEMLLAYRMNGEPLQPQHGYPLRLVAPAWYGMASVKWLHRIDLIAEPFQGYQMVGSYRYTRNEDELGEPVTVMRVRALMVPPGIPDFLTRRRLLEAGPVTLTGRAWAGRADVARVEVSSDGGETWAEAELGDTVSPYAWRGWSFTWQATSGRHVLCVRATDADGNVQPTAAPWNLHGMGNNEVQRVEVVVE